MKITVFFIFLSMFFVVSVLLAEDKVVTVDDTVFVGKIVREDSKNVYLEINTGTISIKKSMIKKIVLEEQWGIENHVSRTGNDKKEDELVDESSVSDIIYFPLKTGNRWRYLVRYKPENLYGEAIIDSMASYEQVWCVEGVVDPEDVFFDEFNNLNLEVFRVSVEENNKKYNKIFFTGYLNNKEDQSFLVTMDENKSSNFIFYQRILPLDPFTRDNKKWVDFGQQNQTEFSSTSEVVSVEGVAVGDKYFDNCLLIEKIDEVENQVLKSRFYIWFAPNVGMVKMIHEVLFPQTEDGNLTRSYLFQEYDLIEYELE